MPHFNMDIVEMEEAANATLISLGIKAIWPNFNQNALYGLDEHQLSLSVPLKELIPDVKERSVENLMPAINMMGQVVARTAWCLSRPGEEMEVEQNDMNFVRLQNPMPTDSLLFEGKVIRTQLGTHRATFSIKMWRKKEVTIANGISSLCVIPDKTQIVPPTPIAVASTRRSGSTQNDSRPSAEAPARSTSPPGGAGPSEPKSAPSQRSGSDTVMGTDGASSHHSVDLPTTRSLSPTTSNDPTASTGRRDHIIEVHNQPPPKKIRASLLPRIVVNPAPPGIENRTSAPAAPQPEVTRLPRSILRRGSNPVPTRRVSFLDADDDRVVSVHRFALFNVSTSDPAQDRTLQTLAARHGFTPRNVKYEIMPVTHRNRYMYHFEVFGLREATKVEEQFKGEQWSVRLDVGGWMNNKIAFLLHDLTVEQLVEAFFLALKMASQHLKHAKRWPRRDDLLMRLADTKYIKEALSHQPAGLFTRLMTKLTQRGRNIFHQVVKPRARAN